uniref:Myelin-associated glycoprotein n=1 Tax=Oreochromis niloticus TaxID=8128 RepID=A0A669EHA9_ORENI
MDTLEWLLFLCIYFKVTQIAELSWTADVPNEVKGLLGSCVVIPCSYNYPDPQGKAKSFTGIWMTTEGDRVIYHPTQSKIVKQYQSRTKLLGDASKNCSLMIEKLQQDDRGPFYFRIEIEGYNRASYRKNKVSISVMDEPNPIDFSVQEEVKEGQTVSAFCSVSHSCPTYPPDFHWSHPGVQHFQAQKLQNGQWNSTSTLTFCSNRTDHNKSLQCSVTYHEGKHQETSKTIKVKYAPVNVKVEYQSDVNEGETAHLKCSSDANPVSSYEWHSETGALLNKGETYTMSNVSRNSVEAVYVRVLGLSDPGSLGSHGLVIVYVFLVLLLLFSMLVDVSVCVCMGAGVSVHWFTDAFRPGGCGPAGDWPHPKLHTCR